MSRQERSVVRSLLNAASYDAHAGVYSASLSYDKIRYHVTTGGFSTVTFWAIY